MPKLLAIIPACGMSWWLGLGGAVGGFLAGLGGGPLGIIAGGFGAATWASSQWNNDCSAFGLLLLHTAHRMLV